MKIFNTYNSTLFTRGAISISSYISSFNFSSVHLTFAKKEKRPQVTSSYFSQVPDPRSYQGAVVGLRIFNNSALIPFWMANCVMPFLVDTWCQLDQIVEKINILDFFLWVFFDILRGLSVFSKCPNISIFLSKYHLSNTKWMIWVAI